MRAKAVTIEKSIGTFLLCLGMAGPAAGGSSRTWTHVMRQRVAEAISAAGAPISADQVVFLGEVRATPDARFAMVGVGGHNSNGTAVKLRCQSSRDCLPFYVVLQGGEVAKTLAHLATAASAGGHGRTAGAEKQRAVKGGDRATLVLEGKDMRIVMPVICLQNGSLGQSIRVSSRDHKKIYEAEVVETGLVKGTL
jgi:flagellar basal body P-ring formation chaperone FlgA